MESRSEFAKILDENLSPSFFKNSLTVSSIEEERRVGERPENRLHSFFFIRINFIRMLRLKIDKEQWRFKKKQWKS